MLGAADTRSGSASVVALATIGTAAFDQHDTRRHPATSRGRQVVAADAAWISRRVPIDGAGDGADRAVEMAQVNLFAPPLTREGRGAAGGAS